jgi:FixJ family two-component response regulator
MLDSTETIKNLKSGMPEPRIFIVDDDISVRRGISLLLNSAGYLVETFENIRDLLKTEDINMPGCILLDIFLGEESGLELQDAIKNKFRHIPIIFITGHGDIPMSVQALKKGAINFLQKPVDCKDLINAVDEAIKNSQVQLNLQLEEDECKALIDSLTPRELEILKFVIRGMLNKQIASKLNIAEHTVKLHRGRITEKLGVKSVPEMILIAEKSNIGYSFLR